jgi:leucyl aminopeptidase
MKVALASDPVVRVDTDLLVVPVLASGFAKHPAVKDLDEALGGGLSKLAKQCNFEGKKGQSLTVHTLGKVKARTVLLLGMAGDEVTADECRRIGAAAARGAREVKKVAVLSPAGDAALLGALAEGMGLGAYAYADFLTGSRRPKPAPRGRVLVEGKISAAQRRAVREAAVVVDAVNMARDMVNCPPNVMNATAMAEQAKKAATEAGIRCTVWGKKQIEKKGMRLLSAVNAGSREEPRFIHMAYVPKLKRKVPRLVFVGKGLTFDAGGLCIKPGKSMETMKCDMAGGAATIAIAYAAAMLRLPVEVHAVVPSTDNMLGEDAYRPGDIYHSLDGKTVEIINTDAEGRLILADALAYARDLDPTVLIDHATLTGACMVALGPWTAGLYANGSELSDRYKEAAERSGESYWHMPLNEDLRESLKSPIADLKHTGDPYGGSITAALFLREFVGACDWIHLDIAGPAFQSGQHGVSPKGGTGFGVRTAVEFIRSYA